MQCKAPRQSPRHDRTAGSSTSQCKSKPRHFQGCKIHTCSRPAFRAESEVESGWWSRPCFTGCERARVRLFSCSVRVNHIAADQRELFGKGLAPRENNGARETRERERERIILLKSARQKNSLLSADGHIKSENCARVHAEWAKSLLYANPFIFAR